jgi:hypothetical protein
MSKYQGGASVEVSIAILSLAALGNPEPLMSETQLVEWAFQNLHHHQAPKPCNMSDLVLIHTLMKY